jgi:uncharacterized protein YjbJ (UPF0337 family)
MTDTIPADRTNRAARGAARETVGTLPGDDAGVRKGRAERDAGQTGASGPAPEDR